MKRFMALCCISIFFLWQKDISALDIRQEEIPQEEQVCQENLYTLEGDENLIIQFSEEFKIQTSTWNLDTILSSFRLMRWTEKLDAAEWKKYTRIFQLPGKATLIADVKDGNCSYELKKELQIYSTLYLYIWNQVQNIEQNFGDFFQKNDIYFLSLPQKNENLDITTTQWGANLVQHHNDILSKSQKIFIDESVSINVLDSFVKSLKTYKDLSFSEKDIFIVTSRNNSFLSKVLAPYIKQLGIKKIGFIKKDSFLDSLNSIISQTPANISYTSFEKEQWFFSLNIFIRYLTYSGLELSFIWLFLSIALAILGVNITKQCIWLNAFGVYYPILLALCLVLLNISFVAVFFIIWFFSIYLVSLLSKKIYLLYVSKRTVLITLFLILTLLFLGIDNYFSLGIIDISTFSNKFILFPFLFLLLIADKVLHEEVQVFSKKWGLYFFELTLVTTISYFIMSSTTIQYFLLTFPDLLFLFLILNIFIAQYTGLQLLEYVRFTPLLKKLSEEEE